LGDIKTMVDNGAVMISAVLCHVRFRAVLRALFWWSSFCARGFDSKPYLSPPGPSTQN